MAQRVTIGEVRRRVERINEIYGISLHVERNYSYYNIYNGGTRVGIGHTAKEAENIVGAFEAGLNTIQNRSKS